jgi:hypothetical protein
MAHPGALRPELPAGFTREFRRLYDQRRPGGPSNRPDPAVARDLDMMIDSAFRLLKVGVSRGDVENQIEAACEHSIGGADWGYSDVPGAISLHADSIGGFRFIVARMGPVTRMAVIDRHWKRISLPTELLWNYPWEPSVRRLPSGMILVSEIGIIPSEGARDGVRLVWLAMRHGAFRRAGSFEGDTTLDYTEPIVRGNRVKLTTVDDPKTFAVTSSMATLQHDRTWDCSRNRLKLIRDDPLQPGLRLADRTIWEARHKKHPTTRQLRIKTLWPEDDGSLDCSEKWYGRKSVVIVGTSIRFDLRYNSQGKPIIVRV